MEPNQPQPVSPVVPMGQTQGPTAPAATPAPEKKSSPVLFIVLGVILLIGIIGFVIYSLFFSKVSMMGKETNLVWWGLWEDESLVAPLIAEYEQANPKVKIQYVKQSHQEYRERLTNALARGQGPDIFRFHNTWVPMLDQELDTLPASVMSAAEFSQTFYPIAVSDLTVGTSLVGVPLGYDGLGLYINEDLFAEKAIEVPKTWDDLRAAALQLTQKDGNSIIQSGVALGRTENVDHWPEILALMMLQNNVKMSSPVGSLAEAALTYYTIFSSVDEVWDETLPPSTALFASGKLAMYFGPSWRAFEIKAQNPNLKFKVVPVPQLPKDRIDEPNINYASYWVEGVWNRSPNKEEAWKFLKFLSSKESLQKLYLAASQSRIFGEPYPRVDMRELLINDPVAGAFVAQAPEAKTSYLQSRTFDGPTGINSQITKYFEDAVNAVNQGIRANQALETVNEGVRQVLSQYGLTTSTPQ